MVKPDNLSELKESYEVSARLVLQIFTFYWKKKFKNVVQQTEFKNKLATDFINYIKFQFNN